MGKVLSAQIDVDHLALIRQNVVAFMTYAADKYGQQAGRLLDIAPQAHEGARPFFGDHIQVETFDIDSDSGCDYIGDITKTNEFLDDAKFDFIVCTEVLEHTLQPFYAVQEMWRLLKSKGLLFLTVPFNFRIHGPLPDCWRFTEHGLRALMTDRFEIIELNALEASDRPLMPIHYTLIAQKVEHA